LINSKIFSLRYTNMVRLILLIILSCIVTILVGCTDGYKYKKEAISIAIKHMEDKYSLKLSQDDIKNSNVYHDTSSIWVGPPNGNVLITFKNGYSVFVDLDIKNKKMQPKSYDDFELLQIKKDIEDRFIIQNRFLKEYYIDIFKISSINRYNEYISTDSKYDGDLDSFLEHESHLNLYLNIIWWSEDDTKSYVEENKTFVNSLKEYFKGNATKIESHVFKTSRYSPKQITTLLQEQRKNKYYSNPNYYSNSNELFGYFYVINTIKGEYENPSENNEIVNNQSRNSKGSTNWKETISCAKFVELEKGLATTATIPNFVFKSKDDLIYEKTKYGERNKSNIFYFQGVKKIEFSNPWLPSNIIKVKNYINGTESFDFELDPYQYFINYSNEDTVRYNLNADDGVYVKIDKNLFADGKLKKGYKIVFPKKTEDGMYLIREPKDVPFGNIHMYYENNDVLYFFKKSSEAFVLTKTEQ